MQPFHSLLQSKRARRVSGKTMFSTALQNKIVFEQTFSSVAASQLVTSRGFPEYVPSEKGYYSFLRVLTDLFPKAPLDSLLTCLSSGPAGRQAHMLSAVSLPAEPRANPQSSLIELKRPCGVPPHPSRLPLQPSSPLRPSRPSTRPTPWPASPAAGAANP